MSALYLLLESGSLYRVELLPEVKVVRLRGSKGATYDCRVVNGRGECDCPDWIARHANSPNDLCKHLRGLKEAKLL